VLNLSQAARANLAERIVHLDGQVGHVVVRLGHGGSAEGVGFDHVRTGGQVGLVDVGDHVRACQAQQLVVAFDVFGEVFETVALTARAGVAFATVLGLAQLEALDHGAHGAVQNGDAAGQNARERLGAGIGDGLHGAAHYVD